MLSTATHAIPCFKVATITAATGAGVVEIDVMSGVVATAEAGVTLDASGVRLAGATIPALKWFE